MSTQRQLLATLLSALAVLPAAGLLIHGGGVCALRRARPATAAATAIRLVAADKETLTVTLLNCEGGVGVGLDDDNIVDLLKPGLPAEKALKEGDKVIKWNGVPMMQRDAEGNFERRLLKDVVTPAESHTLVIERECKPWETSSWERGDQSYEKPSWESSGSSWG